MSWNIAERFPMSAVLCPIGKHIFLSDCGAISASDHSDWNYIPRVRARMEKAMMGMSQQKKAMIKQRVISSVSMFLISPYFTMRTAPRAAIPTTTIDQPRMSHLKKSAKELPHRNGK